MGSSNYNVNLKFTADTSDAKRNIADLQSALSVLTTKTPVSGTQFSKPIQEAIAAAKELEVHFNNAFNTKTGNFDLSKLSNSLQKSGTDLSTLSSNLLKAGLDGEKAFVGIQKAVATASVQIKTSNGLLDDLLKTLGNVAKYQFSTKVYQGMVGSLQKAYSYAQDLDKSLNDIRIVTGQNIEQMSQFAEKANKAAKALSATTLDYTNASLIYYQQGLTDKEVEERINVTIKMANATGVSAATVSDQLTAVWNNFYDGSKSLEYYADVMTALGAATASSTDEISEGLEKFASVAETVGLSYEYATAALATVTATTRQSADVVGTAFKTLFARLQDLELGDTLDDGTTLGQYSEALNKVGINIKDTNGEMKDMDDILDELGAKWTTLSKSTQVALAQTVAGTRQYTQLVSLMDNWDYFKKNVGVADSSSGALQEQADIYAQSWEAARDRVQAAAEAIYDTILDEQFFIKIDNGIEKILTGFNEIVKGVGGFEGVLLLISNIALTKLQPSISNAFGTLYEKAASAKTSMQELGQSVKKSVVEPFQNVKSVGDAIETTGKVLATPFAQASSSTKDMSESLTMITQGLGSARKQSEYFANNLAEGASQALKTSQSMNADVIDKIAKKQLYVTDAYASWLKDSSQIYNLQGLIEKNSRRFTSAEQEKLSMMQQQLLVAAEQKMNAQERLDIAKEEYEMMTNATGREVEEATRGSRGSSIMSGIEVDQSNRIALENQMSMLQSVTNLKFALREVNGEYQITSTSVHGIGEAARQMQVQYGEILDLNQKIAAVAKDGNGTVKEKKNLMKQIVATAQQEGKISGTIANKYIAGINTASKDANTFGKSISRVTTNISNFGKKMASAFGVTQFKETEAVIFKIGQATTGVTQAQTEYNSKLQTMSNTLSELATKASTFGQHMSGMISGASTVAMGLSSITNAIETINDTDASWTSKITAGTMAATQGIRMMSTAVNGAKTVFSIFSAASGGVSAAGKLLGDSAKKAAVEQALANAVVKNGKDIDKDATIEKTKKVLQDWLGIDATRAETIAQEHANLAGETDATVAGKQTVANIKLASSEYSVLWPLLLIVAAVAAVVAAYAIWDMATETTAEKLEKATATAKALNEAQEEAADAADKLREAMEGYKSAVDSLKDCVKGTEEFDEALKEANDSAKEVINTLSGLTADEWNDLYTINDDGLIVLNKDIVSSHQTELDQQETAATLAAALGQYELAQTTKQSKIESAISGDYSDGQYQAVYGWAESSKSLEEFVKHFNSMKLSNGKYNGAYGIYDYEDLEELYQNLSSISDASDAAAAKLRAIAEIEIRGQLPDDTSEENVQATTNTSIELEKKYREAYLKLMTGDGYQGNSQRYQKSLDAQKVLTDYTGELGISKASGSDNDVYQYIASEFEKYNLGYSARTGNTVLGSDTNRRFIFTDKDGNATEEKSAEWVAATLAAARVASEAEGISDNVGDYLSHLDSSVDESEYIGLTSLLSKNNVNSLSERDAVALQDTLSGSDADVLSLLRDKWGAETDDELLQIYGKDSTADLLESLRAGVKNTVDNFSNLFNDLPGEVIEPLRTVVNDQSFSYDVAEKMQSAMSKAYTTSGLDASKNLGTAFVNAGEDADVLAEALANVNDWTDPNAINDLNATLEEQGVDVSSLGSEWNNFCQSMVDASTNAYTLINALDSLRDSIASIKKITKDISFGDVISDEDYQTLLSYNKELASMFTMTYDGWKFIGDENALTAALQGSYSNINKIKSEFEESRNAGSNLLSMGEDSGLLDEDGNLDIQVGTEGVAHLDEINNMVNSGNIDAAIKASSMNKDTFAEMYKTLTTDGIDKESDAYKNALSQYQTFVSELNSFASNYQDGMFDNANAEELGVNSTIDSVEELDAALRKGAISEETYAKTLESVLQIQAETYGLEEDIVNAYRDMLGKRQGLEGDGATRLDEYLNSLSDSEADAALGDIAITTARLTKGLKSLGSNWADWNEVMSDGEATIDQIAEILPDINDSIADILDWDLSDIQNLGADFYQDNWSLIQDVYNGVDGAIERLAGLATKKVQLDVIARPEEESLAQAYNSIAAYLSDMPDLEVGMALEDQPIYNALTALLANGAITVDQMNAILSGIGFTPTIEPVTMKVSDIAQGATSESRFTIIDPVTGEQKIVTGTNWIEGMESEQEIQVVGINGEPKIQGTSVYTGGGGVKAQAPKDSSGGGGSKPKKVDLTKKSDVVDRYKEINDAIEDNSQAMDKASKAADRLYGEARLKKMREVNGLIQQEISLNKQKREEALKYLATDKADLQDAAKAAGVSFTFDEDGDITNYTDQMTKLWEELHAAQAAANADGNADEDEQEAIQKIQDKIDAVSEAVDQYEETKSLIEDLDDEIQEQIYEWQDNNLELLQQEIELKIEINEDELEWLEYLLKRAESDVYKIAEAFSYLTQKQDISLKNLETYNQGLTDTYNKATKVNPETGLYDLSQSDAIEELKELKSNIINELSTLLDLDADALAYYGDALASISEEVEKYTSQFDDLNTTLDHYNTLLELTGQSKNYKAMDKVLSAQADVAKNQAAIAKRQYETYANEVNDWKSKMEAAQAAGDEAAYELYKKNYEAAYENMAAAQDDMYTKTEEWLEDMKALYENKLADLGEQLEKALTGGISFDELTTAMERSSSLQEEYLTTTNQIYETNKLMRQAQQEIDKTTNSVAKKKLAAYIQETEQLQNQSKLSNYELEIQQAKYDLLLAEIALEEAQQAKSTVRLQRDSEGNLGYVYTADADKIANAEQKLADKQNALYNIGLEGANDYAEKYSQTMQEMYETLSELHQQYLDGEFASEEEYNNAVAAAKEYYYQKLEDYSSLYKVALTTDSRVIKDAWSSDYNDMIYKVEELKDSIENYLSESKSVLSSWSQDVKFAIEESGLGDMEQAVKNVTDASKGLNDYLTGEDGLLDTMDKEIEKVNAATTAYALERDAILDLAKAYEKAIKQANEYIKIIEKTDNTAEQKKTDLNTDTSTADTSSNETAVEKTLSTGSTVKVKTSAKKFASGQYMASFVPGGTYTVMNINGEKVLIGKGGSATGWVYKSDLEGFDTGGYTGEWGSYGKLAMLHQKELVLNAGDTENFLASMEVLDHILEIIDLQSASSRLGGLLSSPTIGNNDSVIEQHIDIHAEFPNATSHSEIEEAFNNLINQASQYANRK